MGHSPEVVDVAVRAGLNRHEAVCAERWGQVRTQLLGVERAIEKMRSLVITCAGGLIIGMATLILTLFTMMKR